MFKIEIGGHTFLGTFPLTALRADQISQNRKTPTLVGSAKNGDRCELVLGPTIMIAHFGLFCDESNRCNLIFYDTKTFKVKISEGKDLLKLIEVNEKHEIYLCRPGFMLFNIGEHSSFDLLISAGGEQLFLSSK